MQHSLKIVENIQMEKWQTSWSSWENRNIFMPMGNGDPTGSKEMYKSYHIRLVGF